MKKKIYAVRKGRKTGIFTDWLETYEQIRGYSNAEFRGFTYSDTLDKKLKGSLAYATAEAEAYLKAKDCMESAEDAGKKENAGDEISGQNSDVDKNGNADNNNSADKKTDTENINTFEDMDDVFPLCRLMRVHTRS